MPAGEHARRLRSLTELRGNPTVIAACHPTKNALDDNLVPRGGGAYIAEVDGNTAALKKDGVVEFHKGEKFRGPDFDPIHFKLLEVRTSRLVDASGRQVPTVLARHITKDEQKAMTSNARRDEDALLIQLDKHPDASIAGLAEAAGWLMGNGLPYKTKVSRTLDQLKRDKMAKKIRGTWTLTSAGKSEAKRVRTNLEMAGATYG